jgi:hypothetical protein
MLKYIPNKKGSDFEGFSHWARCVKNVPKNIQMKRLLHYLVLTPIAKNANTASERNHIDHPGYNQGDEFPF